MSAPTRVGLALARPRAALAMAGDRERAGRSGTDLLIAIAVLVVVTRIRALVSGVWLGVLVEPVLGVRAVAQTLTDALAIDLGFLVLGALVIWASAGARRDLGRASDLACVAVLPLVIVELVATVVVLLIGLFTAVEVPRWLTIALSVGSYVWTSALIVLATREGSQPTTQPVEPTPLARRAGWALTGAALAGLVAQVIWIVPYLDRMRPVTSGDPAPDFTLPRIGPNGAPGSPFSLAAARGQTVIVDFWATWCQPCVRSLPRLEAVHRKHPEVVVVAVNIDDAAAARALFDEAGYTLTLLAGSQEVTDRYDVAAIPHTVVIDAQGVVRRVHRGGGLDLEREISTLSAPPGKSTDR